MSDRETEPVAEVDIGGPEPEEPATVEASTSAAVDNDNKVSDMKAEVDTNGATAEPSSSTSTSKRPAQDDDAPAAATASANDRSQPPSKRQRPAAAGGAQRRLFGVLTKTLSKFQEETKKDSQASKRRAELEERLAAKKREEQKAIDARTGHERALRNLRYELMKKEDEKNAYIAIYQARKAQKLSLANFLCTKAASNVNDASSSSANIGNLKPAPLPELPHALPPSSMHSSSSTKPLYYLPYKLLPWQADKIDGQVEDMRLDLEKEEDAWKDELLQREEEIVELKKKRSELAGGNEDAIRPPRRSRRDAAEDEEMIPAAAAKDSKLAERAPLPERDAYDELSGDARAASADPPREKEDSAMAGMAEGDDRLEY